MAAEESRSLKPAVLLALALLTACRAPSNPGEADGASDDGWTRPPSILEAAVRGGDLVVTGLAEPEGRVVLRGDLGAYATAADGEGRFRLVAPAPQASVLLTPETQVGQQSAASPERLAILDGGRGPIAVLRLGAPALRLDAGTGLDALDGDGRRVLASGRASAPVALTAEGRMMEMRPDRAGAWTASLDIAPGDTVSLGSAIYAWPGAGEAVGIDRTEGGWRIVWSASPGTRQTTWLPDRRSGS